MLTGLTDLLLSGFIAINYAQLFHVDPNDFGPTVIARMTDTDPDAPNAYHLLQSTMNCNGKRGVVCIQRQGTLTVFLGGKRIHTSSINERGPNQKYPSLGAGCVQKTKVLSVSRKRSDILDDFVCFPILETYSKESGR
jgi:hypothetical protein